MNIIIQSRQFGWFSEEPVTVTKTKDSEIVWCNHADSFIEPTISIRPDDTERVVGHTLNCGKCGAYRNETEDNWIDAPEEGITDEL